MKDNYFDDILKNSMETPRSIPFDESAWERMEQQMPKPAAQSAWKSWLKFLPIAIGMLGLLSWNICLQQEINYMQKHPNVIVETEDVKPKVIYKIDTIYQITERKVSEETIKKYFEQYVKNIGLSHTQDRFITSNNSFLLKPNSFITSNPNNIFSGSYNPNTLSLKSKNFNRDFFTSSTYNPIFSNLNIANGSDTVQIAQMDSIQSFANQLSNNDFLNNENSTTENSDLSNNSKENITESDLTINEEISKENLLEELESKPILDIDYYQNLGINNQIDIVNASRPSSIKPTFRSKLRFQEFSAGIGNSIGTNTINNGALIASGLHLGAYILPNTSLEVELNYLNSDYDIYNTYSINNSFYPNTYPHPSYDQIPADYSLNYVYLDAYAFQVSLGLKRIFFKDEHIRPFGEIGWLINKEHSGDLFYSYVKREGNETTYASIDYIPLDNTDYLKWDFSQIYAGGGLSFSLLNGKVDLDLGLRLTQSLKSTPRFDFSPITGSLLSTRTTGIGSFASLTYNF